MVEWPHKDMTFRVDNIFSIVITQLNGGANKVVALCMLIIKLRTGQAAVQVQQVQLLHRTIRLEQ